MGNQVILAIALSLMVIGAANVVAGVILPMEGVQLPALASHLAVFGPGPVWIGLSWDGKVYSGQPVAIDASLNANAGYRSSDNELIGQTLSLYINGSLVQTQTTAAGLLPGTGYVTFHWTPQAAGDYLVNVTWAGDNHFHYGTYAANYLGVSQTPPVWTPQNSTNGGSPQKSQPGSVDQYLNVLSIAGASLFVLGGAVALTSLLARREK